MSRRRAARAAGVAAAAAALLAAAARPAAAPALSLNLTVNGVLEVVLPGGAHLRSPTPGGVVAPGPYQVVVNDEVADAEDGYHLFHLSGPGVNLTTDMLAGDNRSEAYSVTLEPSSTYVFRDDRQPALGSVAFSTSASGAAAGGSTAAGSAASGGGGAEGGGLSNTQVVGSDVLAYRGVLTGAVTRSGRLTLARGGRNVVVGSLPAGRYTVVVRDSSASRGFALQRGARRPVVLTTGAFVGKRSRIVELRAGKWSFSSPGGEKSAFLVVA
ncbi:MAG TPA: hypothetical protein VFB42_04205 [Gaiellaceae bacterium]|nr:hypothetical protein [Gaiellaceae bacterium]